MRLLLALLYCLRGRFSDARILLCRMDTYRVTAQLHGRCLVEVVVAPSMEAAEAMFLATVLEDLDQVDVLSVTAFRSYGAVTLIPRNQSRDRADLVRAQLEELGDWGRAAVRQGHRDWRIIRSGSVPLETCSAFDLCDAALPVHDDALPMVPTQLLWTASYAPTPSRSFRSHRFAALQVAGIRLNQDSCRPALAS